MPVPGRLAVTLLALNRSPVLIEWVATSDLRTMDLFFASLGLGRLIPLPSRLHAPCDPKQPAAILDIGKRTHQP